MYIEIVCRSLKGMCLTGSFFIKNKFKKFKKIIDKWLVKCYNEFKQKDRIVKLLKQTDLCIIDYANIS